MAGVWSPEDLLVAAVTSCYTVTLVALAERRELPLHTLHVSATGHLTARFFLVVYVVAVAATLAPAVRASRILPAEALRYQ